MRNLLIFFLVFSFQFISGNALQTFGQADKADRIQDVAGEFFEVWLIKGDSAKTLEFIAEKPIFPSCLFDKGEGGINWGTTRESVLKNLRLLLEEVKISQVLAKDLSEIIERPKTVLHSKYGNKPNFPRTDLGAASELYDIYPVGEELLIDILSNECKLKKDTESFKAGLRNHKELYLMLTNSKLEDVGLTVIWAREGLKLRIITVDVRFK